jgi:hypothetical protein
MLYYYFISICLTFYLNYFFMYNFNEEPRSRAARNALAIRFNILIDRVAIDN